MTPKEIVKRLITKPGHSQAEWVATWTWTLRELLRDPDLQWHFSTSQTLSKLGLVRIVKANGWLTRKLEVIDPNLVRSVLEVLEHPHDWNTP